MNKELVTTFGTDNWQEIAAATGANVGKEGLLPSLKMNRESENDLGQTVPIGTFMVTQNGVSIYSKVAQFRIFLNTYQYMVYDAKTNTFPNKSIIIKNFNEQAIDELGGLKCGKINGKEFKELVAKGLVSKQEEEAQKAIKCYRGLYGLVTFENAVTADGDATTIENLPVLWRMGGDNFNAAQDTLKSIDKMRHLYFQHWIALDTERKKQGSNVWYFANMRPILNKEIEFSAEDMVTFTMFQESINKENLGVANKWRESKKATTADAFMDGSLSELELNDDISDLG